MYAPSRSAVSALVVSVASLIAAQAHAAPASSDDADTSKGSTQAPAVPKESDSGRSTGSPTQPPNTVELLLKLQDQPTVSRQTTPAKPASAAQAGADESNDAIQTIKGLKSSLLSSDNSNSSARTDNPERAQAQRASDRLNSSIAGDKRTQDGAESGSSLLSNPVVRFIRENRLLTAGGSVLLLIAVWATATFSLRRGR